jgi:hypothetical protein
MLGEAARDLAAVEDAATPPRELRPAGDEEASPAEIQRRIAMLKRDAEARRRRGQS